MSFYSTAAPPDRLKRIKVSRKTLAQLTEQIPDYQRLHYNMNGYPNIEISGILYFVGPRYMMEGASPELDK